MIRPLHRQGKPPRRRRGVLAAFAGIAAVGLLGVVTQTASADDFGEPDALAAAAKIPNDQGHSADCPASAAAKPGDKAGKSASQGSDPHAGHQGADAAKQPAGRTPSRSASQSASSPAAKAADKAANCHADQGGPSASDFVDIRSVKPNAGSARAGRKGSGGTFVSVCGTNGNGHRNPDNFIVAPGVSNGAQHVHDYVGNLSTDGFSTNDSLAAAGTTCQQDDRSTYFWPVLRDITKKGADLGAAGGGADGNVGQILNPTDVKLEFRSTRDKVTAMPRFLRIITGDAKALTNGPANARAQWTCTGFTDRVTNKYPLCPAGSQVQRMLDFPSCWDGKNTDSANHRSHIVFPRQDGRCPRGTKAVPQLRMTLTYQQPAGPNFALDSFPDQLHNPNTDHADFANVMPGALMATAVDCINRGRSC